MILTTAQAEAVCRAMLALNKVGLKLSARQPGALTAWEDNDGTVRVQATGALVEAHENQAAFAAAYGLQ